SKCWFVQKFSSQKQKIPKKWGFKVIASGFEPETVCLEGRCSIQLSYATNNNKKTEQCVRFLSGWQDSNLRPPAPKAGAITGLRYTPKKFFRTLTILTSKTYSKSGNLEILFVFMSMRRDRDSNPGDGCPSTD